MYRADVLLGIIGQRRELGVDVTLERNVCALLLGKRSEAQGQLVAAHAATAATHGTGSTAFSDEEDGASLSWSSKGVVSEAQGQGGPQGAAAAAAAAELKAAQQGAHAGAKSGPKQGGARVAGAAGAAGGSDGRTKGQAGKRSSGHERLQLGADDSAFVVMVRWADGVLA